MNDLRGFYGRLAARFPAEESLRVADPESHRGLVPHNSAPFRGAPMAVKRIPSNHGSRRGRSPMSFLLGS